MNFRKKMILEGNKMILEKIREVKKIINMWVNKV